MKSQIVQVFYHKLRFTDLYPSASRRKCNTVPGKLLNKFTTTSENIKHVPIKSSVIQKYSMVH